MNAVKSISTKQKSNDQRSFKNKISVYLGGSHRGKSDFPLLIYQYIKSIHILKEEEGWPHIADSPHSCFSLRRQGIKPPKGFKSLKSTRCYCGRKPDAEP